MLEVNPDVKSFLETPSEETFAKITKIGPSLFQVLTQNRELAKQYFKFDDWLALEKNCILTIDEEMKHFIKEQRNASISSFNEAYRYYLTLCHVAKRFYAPRLIAFAKTEDDLEKLTSTFNGSLSAAIEKRRSEILSSSAKA